MSESPILQARQKRTLNYRFRPDPRLPKYRGIMHLMNGGKILPEVDLELGIGTPKVKLGPVRDQGQEGACTAFASVSHYESLVRQYKPDFAKISEQGFYKIERMFDGDFSQDAGSSLSTAADRALHVGFPEESFDAYTDATEFSRLTKAELANAKMHTIGAAYAITNPAEELQICLSNGFGAVGGIICCPQMMEDGFDGYLPILTSKDVLIEGGYPAGHAIHIIGYKMVNGVLYFKIRNSWGPAYGDHGNFWMAAQNVYDSSWFSDCQTFRLAHQPGLQVA